MLTAKKLKITALFIFLFLGWTQEALCAKKPAHAAGENDAIILSAGGFSEKVSAEELKSWFSVSPQLYFSLDRLAEIENIRYCPEGLFFCDFILTSEKRLTVSRKMRFKIKKESIVLYLEDFARKFNRDPTDAKFNLENGKIAVFSLSEKGLRLDVEKSSETVARRLEEKGGISEKETEIVLVYEIIEPQITSESLDNLGIDSLVGEGSSNFRGSPRNRIHNIRVSASRFNGTLIKPGEEFSFLKILGEVDAEHGYLPELVIKYNKTEPEFGGGICQVSTTAFRAAIHSGLKITARRNHAYPVQYYNPQGMDATVYIPSPDLRFLNNTPGHILVQTEIKGTKLTFRFYGTTDGRKVEIDGPKILEKSTDGSMKTVFTQTVTDRENKEIIKDIFNSAYDSPSKFPHSGQEKILKEKPKNWSSREWKEYKKTLGI